MRFSMLTALLSIATINLTLACECGIGGYSQRIYNGTKVSDHKYPWMALIRMNIGIFCIDIPNNQCGGSLIDETHVITAAHCVVDDNKQAYSPERIDVFLGRVKAFTEFSGSYRVSNVWFDPNFDQKSLANDFAILTLSEPVKYSDKIRPVCLPNSENGLSKLTVTGWGRTIGNFIPAPYTPPSSEPLNSLLSLVMVPVQKVVAIAAGVYNTVTAIPSNGLMEAEVDFINKTECNELAKIMWMKQNGIDLSKKNSTNYFKVVPDSHLCAIDKETKGDTCTGDSGGPLMHHGDNGLWYLMGVTSGAWTSQGCGPDKDTPSLYTRILYYKNVIESMAPNACWQDL